MSLVWTNSAPAPPCGSPASAAVAVTVPAMISAAVSGASACEAPLLLQQHAGEQAQRRAEDPVADPPAPVWRRAVEGLDLLRVDDPVDEDRLDGDAVRGPEHDCPGGVRPATENRGQH